MENKEKTILMQRYELGRLLGQGNFAKVYHARNLKTGQSVAIKVFNKEMVTRVGMIEQIKREISIMRRLRHPNVVQLYEVMASKTKIYFVMECVKGGELFDKVSRGKLREDVARKYFQALIDAVDYCHSKGVFHRDLKPENVLLDENGDLKISDFGLSALLESRKIDGLLHTTCGTPAYVAPEVIKKKGYDGDKADIWSCGVILYVLLAGYLPFNDRNLMEMYRKIGKGDFKCPPWIAADSKKLLRRILDPNPKTRISITRIMDNSWFRKGYKQIEASKCPPLSNRDGEDFMDIEAAFSSPNSEASTMLTREEYAMKPYYFNAFDLISISSGFDLSGLFERDMISQREEARFITTKPPSMIVSKLEEIAYKDSIFKVMKKNGTVRLEGKKTGRQSQLIIDAEIFEVTSSFHIVEVKKTFGDSLEYWKLWEHDLKPSLNEIVLAWQVCD
ncbi:hypothetical protein Lal_00022336 [Lupinus albus]|uniref:non-specific serine/threonine protein kinase n=1 Tax=Lupinus albus TaxID=3870 RepID=A0A6A4PA35_LUPAL|nr:putative protein kinase CAMK-CAMKL-CHK1 family [Lupinus albus]KAF1894842.1 hypothetical protein Lal_00022336 [Lupinus albus]